MALSKSTALSRPLRPLSPALGKLLVPARRVLGAVKRAGVKLGIAAANEIAAIPGYYALLGGRYPVKHYQAQVSPTLRRGSRVDRAGLRALRLQGYRAVVALTAERNWGEEPTAKALGMSFQRIPIIDGKPPTMDQMKTFLDFVTKPRNQPVYVHCQAGHGRTGVAVAVYRMAVEGWPLKRALAEAKQHSFWIPSQQAFLRTFDRELRAGNVPGYPLR